MLERLCDPLYLSLLGRSSSAQRCRRYRAGKTVIQGARWRRERSGSRNGGVARPAWCGFWWAGCRSSGDGSGAGAEWMEPGRHWLEAIEAFHSNSNQLKTSRTASKKLLISSWFEFVSILPGLERPSPAADRRAQGGPVGWVLGRLGELWKDLGLALNVNCPGCVVAGSSVLICVDVDGPGRRGVLGQGRIAGGQHQSSRPYSRPLSQSVMVSASSRAEPRSKERRSAVVSTAVSVRPAGWMV